jgi:hypothetical protein
MESSRNSVATYNVHVHLANIPGLHGQVFESATIISGNSYCYYRSGINERKLNIGQEDARMVKVLR